MPTGHSRPKLFGVPALVVMAVLAAALLYVLHPRDAFFDQIGRLAEPDALSLAYLSVLLDSDPKNDELRLRLAQMQAQVGQAGRAAKTLAPLLEGDQVPAETIRLALSLKLRKLAAANDSKIREQYKNDLMAMIRRFGSVSQSEGHIHSMVGPVLGWLTPEEQLGLLPPLIASSQGEDRLWLMLTLGHAQVASGNPLAAANTLAEIIDQLPVSEQQAAGQELVRLYLAAGRPKQALAVFRHRQLLSKELVGLAQGVRLARLAGDENQELEWLKELTRQRPSDLPTLRRMRALQLGRGELAAASKTAQRIIGLQGVSIDDRLWAARALEWVGRPGEARVQWQAIYEAEGNPESYRRSVTLARELFRWSDLLDILELARARSDLDEEGYLALGNAYIANVDLDAATVVFEEGVKRYPDEPGFVDRLYGLYVNNNRYEEAIALFERKSALSERERLLLANLYWRTRQMDKALETVSAEFADPGYFAEAELMRLDLLTLLGDESAIREEYLRLMASARQQEDPGVVDRLIGLAAQFGEFDRVAELAQLQFERTESARYLPILADAQANTGQWRALASSLRLWRRFPMHDRDARYWAFSGRLYEHRGDLELAERAYRQALRLSPGSEDILSAWGWLRMGRTGENPDKLAAILGELASITGQQQYALLAYGYASLGQESRARYWLQSWREQSSDGWRPLTEQAELSQRLGDESDAFHLRRYAARQEPERIEPRTPSRRRQPEMALAGQQSQPVFFADNRALQLGWQREKISNMAVDQWYSAWDYSAERFRLSGRVAQLKTSDDVRLVDNDRSSQEGFLELQNNATDWLLSAGLGYVDRLEGETLHSRFELRFKPTRRSLLVLGQHSGERATDSAEAWWLVGRNRTSVEANYQADSRTTLGGRMEWLSFDAGRQNDVASGHRLELFGTHVLARQYPDWSLRAEYVLQDLGQIESLDDHLQRLFERPLQTTEIITEYYERLSLGMRWQEQAPHSLLEQRAQPGWFVDVSGGYVLSNDTFEYGFSGGLSWSVVGNDEIALSAGYSSDSLSGNSTLDARLTYTVFFQTSGDVP